MNGADLAITVPLVLPAYLIGAVPFGYVTAKWLKGIDIRTVGSGNIGATNVGRVLGFRFFLLVFAFDLAKGLPQEERSSSRPRRTICTRRSRACTSSCSSPGSSRPPWERWRWRS